MPAPTEEKHQAEFEVCVVRGVGDGVVDEIGVGVDEMPVLGVVEGGGVGVEIGPEVVE